MYSERVTDSQIRLTERSHKGRLHLVRHTVSECDDMGKKLASAVDESGNQKRKLTEPERDFVRNERILSKIDWNYWRERYSYLIRDPIEGGGLGRFDHLWDSQTEIMRIVAKAEEDAYDAFLAGEPSDGILLVIHKARQLGASMLAEDLLWHRITTTEHLRALIASVEGEKTRLLYDRGERILNNLPWWLKPSIRYSVKGEHLMLDKLDTIVTLQDAKQTTGLGQGEQWDVSHLTECASWPYPNVIEHDFFPTIPQSPLALSFLESTAQGRGNWWHDFTERVRNGKTRRWRYCFIPWYIEGKKYRAKPPANWQPSDVSLLHAKMVYDTSAEWCGGKSVFLPKEQLYWYETTRAEYQEAGKLNIFLTNFCVAGSTMISTNLGEMRIDMAKEAETVESGKIDAWMDQGEKDVMELQTKSGRKLVATPDHEVFLIHDVSLRLDRLRPGDRVLCSDWSSDIVSEVKPAGRTHVYDLSVIGSHRFSANGIIVHNCATPDESFQHSGSTAFTHECLEWARLMTSRAKAVAYDLVTQ